MNPNWNIKTQNHETKNISEKLIDISLGYDFLDLTSKSMATKAKINK